MKLVTITMMLFAAAGPASAMAAIAPSEVVAPQARGHIVLVAFGSGHHAKKNQGPAVPKDPTATVPDMHGATRESADKAYRQKYGF